MGNKIGSDFIFNFMFQTVKIIAPILTAPYVARIIGVEGVGAFAYTHSIAYNFVIFAMLGIKNFGNRSVAACHKNREERSQVFWNTYYVMLTASLLTIIVYLIYGTTMQGELKTITYIQLLYVFTSLFDIDWFFYGMHQFKQIAIRSTVIKIATVGLVFIFVRSINDLAIYTLIMAGGSLLATILLWPLALKQIDFVKPNLQRIVESLKPILVLFAPVIAISIYKVMAKIMLGALTDMAMVGYYENADKIIAVSIGIITSFGTIMMPRMSFLVASGETQKTETYIKKSMEGIMYVASLLAFGIIGVAPNFVKVFYGDKFVASTPLMAGLAITILFMGWANVIRTQYLIPAKKDGVYILSVSIAAVVSLVTNVLLIPLYGAIGAVVATVLAEFVVAFIQTIAVRKELQLLVYIKNSIFPIGTGGIMCFALRYLDKIVTPSSQMLVVEIVVGAFLFAILCVVYALIKKDSIPAYVFRKIKSRFQKKICT